MSKLEQAVRKTRPSYRQRSLSSGLNALPGLGRLFSEKERDCTMLNLRAKNNVPPFVNSLTPSRTGVRRFSRKSQAAIL
jgi:hypothetical protein